MRRARYLVPIFAAPAVTFALAAIHCGADGALPDAGDAQSAAENDAGLGAGSTGRDAAALDGLAPSSDGAATGTDAAPPRDDSGGAHDGGSGALGKIVAGYYPNWTPAPVRIRDIDAHYNLIYLFAATPEGGAPGTTGAVLWTPPGDGRGAATNLNADIAYARSAQGRKILLSIGGSGGGMSFPTRTKSQAFVDSVVAIQAKLGGIDGIDWNTFEGNQAPDTSEMIWISLELKSRFPGFLVTAPPAPWNEVDKTFCSQMVNAGALDYAAPQYYDGPNLATQSYIVGSVDEWAKLVGEERLVVGFGIWDQPNYMTIGQAIPTWNAVKASHPALRGAFDWQIHVDEGQGWPFATQLGPLVGP